MLMPKAIAVWLLILVCAVVNGILRESVLVPMLGPVRALIASGVLLSLAIIAVSTALAPWLGARSASGYLGVGFLWLAMTLTFELGAGYFLQHKTWAELIGAYTFRDGNLWPLVLIVTALAPWLAARLRGLVRVGLLPHRPQR
jgi:hypothetical protein